MDAMLKGKVAIVTGGATGIGEAICHRFCSEGATVIVNGLPDDPVEDVVKKLKKKGYFALGFVGDVSLEQDARACVEVCIDTYGRLDVLVNNAGVFLEVNETQDYTVVNFDKTITSNIRSAFLMTKFALPYLQKSKGVVISAGSEAGIQGLAQNTIYGGTKGWLHAFMKGVAVEQARYGVRANCVCPGPIDTAWTHASTGPMTKKMEKMLIQATPLARRGTVEEVANVYAFLASDAASYVTGALWTVDGGITVSKGPIGKETTRSLRKEPKPTLKNLKHQREGLKNKQVSSH